MLIAILIYIWQIVKQVILLMNKFEFNSEQEDGILQDTIEYIKEKCDLLQEETGCTDEAISEVLENLSKVYKDM